MVDREEAYRRIQAAVDARNEGADIVILARTDARATHGLDEAIERCKMFRQIGYVGNLATSTSAMCSRFSQKEYSVYAQTHY